MYQELTAISRLSFIHIVNFYWFIWTFSLFKSADFVHIDFKDFAALILQILQICLYMSGGINILAVFSPVAIFAVCGCPEAQCLDAMLHNVSEGVWYFGKCLWMFFHTCVQDLPFGHYQICPTHLLWVHCPLTKCFHSMPVRSQTFMLSIFTTV